jgi:ABC-type branched-subunit amino acid transport system ATPase component
VVDHISVLHFGEVVESGSTEHVRRSQRVQEIYLGAG